MAITNVVLRKNKTNKKGMAPVCISYSKDQKTTYFSTGHSILSDHWIVPAKGIPYVDSTKGIRPNKKNEDHIKELQKDDDYKNALIKRQLIQINQIIDRFNIEFHRLPEFDELKELLKEGKQDSNGNPKVNKNLFLDQFEQFKQDCRNDMEHGTWKHYGVTYNHLKSFLEKKKKVGIKLEDFDLRYVNDFKAFLLAAKPKGIGLAKGTAKKNLDRLKKFLRLKNSEGLYSLTNFKDVKVKSPDYADRPKIYLTIEEIKKLRNHSLEPFSKLDKVRDIFLMSCSTGLRFSDVMRLKKEMIKDDVINITTKKNKRPLQIPLFLYAREIFEKYDYTLPQISNQKINDYLKELARAAELNDLVILNEHKGKSTDGKVFKKHELISSHTGRKTFIMLSVENGVPMETLEAITGSTYASLKHYYEITKDKKVKELANVEQAFMKVS